LNPNRRHAVYRGVFISAGLYNICWGVFSIIQPQWLFDFADMPRQNYPEVFQCLAMVVGLYGFLYIEVARDLRKGRKIVFIGLIGKVVGPCGWLFLVATGRWPLKTGILCLMNDLLWWIPFALFLLDPSFRKNISVSERYQSESR
jgi:small multidrug resistance pump